MKQCMKGLKKLNVTTWLVLGFALLIFLPAVLALQGPRLDVSVLRYEPTPTEQGGTVDVWLQIKNRGTEANHLSLKFEKEYPFSLAEGQSENIDVGYLTATEEKVVKFTLTVAPDAPNGEHAAKFWYRFNTDKTDTGTASSWILLEAPLLLQTQNVGLVIDSYHVNPTPLLPGQIATIQMALRNAGTMPAKNVDVILDLDEKTFTTVTSGTKKRISYIDAGKSENVSFDIAAATNTEINLYTIPINFVYQDARNSRYNDSAKISVMVNAQPDVSVVVDSTKAQKTTGPATVSLKIVNKGIANLKYVTLRLMPNKDYELLSPSNEAYVGNIDSDDFQTVDFMLNVKAKNPVLNVSLDFRDPYNKRFEQKYTIPFRLLTDQELGTGGNGFAVVLVILAAGIGATWWYFTKKRRKH